MKHTLALALLASISLAAPAFADDPLPTESPSPSPSESSEPAPASEPELVIPGVDDVEATVPARPAATTTPAKPARARLSSTPTRSTREPEKTRLDKEEKSLLGGRHWRIKSGRGAIHVWVPPGYDRATAGMVVYVHGYWTDADGAWKDYELASQFKKSRQNALFVVPDAPANRDQGVHWPALTDLRAAITRANIRMPDGPIVVMGHSGAFRTVMQWVDHRMVDQIILLDAMYGGEHKFNEFIASGKRADDHKMIVVGASVAQESVAFSKKYKFATAREKVPDTMSGFTKAERRAKLLYIHSQYDHYQMVKNKKVIPLLLRVTRLVQLGSSAPSPAPNPVPWRN